MTTQIPIIQPEELELLYPNITKGIDVVDTRTIEMKYLYNGDVSYFLHPVIKQWCEITPSSLKYKKPLNFRQSGIGLCSERLAQQHCEAFKLEGIARTKNQTYAYSDIRKLGSGFKNLSREEKEKNERIYEGYSPVPEECRTIDQEFHSIIELAMELLGSNHRFLLPVKYNNCEEVNSYLEDRNYKSSLTSDRLWIKFILDNKLADNVYTRFLVQKALDKYKILLGIRCLKLQFANSMNLGGGPASVEILTPENDPGNIVERIEKVIGEYPMLGRKSMAMGGEGSRFITSKQDLEKYLREV